MKFTLLPAMALCLVPLWRPAVAAPAADTTAPLASCDPAIVRGAIDSALRDPAMPSYPVVLFQLAQAARTTGDKEQAAFLYLAARLRSARQLALEPGEIGAAMGAMQMVVAPLVMPALAADPAVTRRVVERLQAWDKATPDPFRERAARAGADAQAKMAQVEADIATGLGRLPDQVAGEAAMRARSAAADADVDRKLAEEHTRRCAPGAVSEASARARIETEAHKVVAAHPLVRKHASGGVRPVTTAATEVRRGELPTRMSLTVTPVQGRPFHAEVLIETTRQGETVNATLLCLTNQWLGQRQALRDVCASDPEAILP
ncbi:hypothetical protein [Pseudoduganella chitinolytica]|uniref:Sel1 repeat family protein n=1 Tax=Pseudoduganella chitinolytica TaxID=34070 RepID=A0ABY8BDU1_9BURK|nr:hypothetical protein [Pseudoduganella chitinolytica]WEF34077.1 hypothetical protein PX653_04700 [Pseudoduganella chitinolytica]